MLVYCLDLRLQFENAYLSGPLPDLLSSNISGVLLRAVYCVAP